MALSMEEQRILAEIEHKLAGDDPSLAVRLSTFGRPGLAAGLRTPRGRVLASFLVVAVFALLSLMVYSLMPLRAAPDRGAGERSAAVPSHSGQSAQASAPAPAVQPSVQAGKPATGGKAASAPAARGTGRGAPRQSAAPSAGPAG